MATIGRRRALGQHFLRDATIARRIAETAVQGALAAGCRSLLEIGPGKGAITLPLLEQLKSTSIDFFLAERDHLLVDYWKAQPLPRPLAILEGDFLDAPEERWLSNTPLAIASNLPYSAGTAILTRLARHPDRIPFMVLMFQAEVAHRLRADPATKAWGSLSVWVQNRWDVKKLLSVPPGAFQPPPEVDSEVVTLVPRATSHVNVPDSGPRAEHWESLLKAAFAHRRKMLRAGLPPGPYRNALVRSGVDGTKRAEALDWAEWAALFSAFESCAEPLT